MMGAGGQQRSAYEAAAREYESRASSYREAMDQIKQGIEAGLAQKAAYKADMESKIAQVSQAGDIPPEQKAAYIAQIRAQYEPILQQIDEQIAKARSQLAEYQKGVEMMEAQARMYRRAVIAMAGQQAEAVHAESSSNRA